MKEPKENYFIAHYKVPQQIPEEFSFVLNTKIENKDINKFNISNEPCNELFIQDKNEHLFKCALINKKGVVSQNKVTFILNEAQKKDLISIKMIKNILILQYAESIEIINIDDKSDDNSNKINVQAEKVLITSNYIFIYSKNLKKIYKYNFEGQKIEEEDLKGDLIDMSNYNDELYVLIKTFKQYRIYLINFLEDINIRKVDDSINPTLINTNGITINDLNNIGIPDNNLNSILNPSIEIDNNDLSHLNTKPTTNSKIIISNYLKKLDNNTTIIQFSMLKNNNFILHLENDGLFFIDNINQTKELIFDKEISSFETDCKDRIWILSENTLYQFGQDIRYKKSFLFYEEFYNFEEDTSWHSLVIDADIPQGTKMEVILNTKDKPTKHFINEKNILLYKEVGKELHIKITLSSDSLQLDTPKINSIKVLFNKSSYLDYLPAYYSDDSESMYRYLAIFQLIMDESSASIDTLADLLDVGSTNDEFLSWLSQWLGLVRDYRWPQDKWRIFLQRAPELYKKAGTKDGLSEIIELYSGKAPEIEEYINKPEKRKENPFFFCVKIDADFSEFEVAVITSIVNEFKPAYTQAKIVLNNKLIDNQNLILDKSVLDYNSVIK